MKIVGQVTSKAEANQLTNIAKNFVVGQRAMYLSRHYKQLNKLKSLINNNVDIDVIVDKAEEFLTDE